MVRLTWAGSAVRLPVLGTAHGLVLATGAVDEEAGIGSWGGSGKAAEGAEAEENQGDDLHLEWLVGEWIGWVKGLIVE